MSVLGKPKRPNETAAAERLEPMKKGQILAWPAVFSCVNADSLAKECLCDLPRLIYELRRWLGLDPGKPIGAEVTALEKKPAYSGDH